MSSALSKQGGGDVSAYRSVKEWLPILGVSRTWLFNQIYAGHLEVTKFGRHIKISEKAMENFLARNTKPAKK